MMTALLVIALAIGVVAWLSGRIPEAISAYKKFLQSIGPEQGAEAVDAQRMLAELERRVPK